uniref:FLYWCH-type domain-containing protein n=1 Tax=Meloidogyne enterolobii TaxID=390850 RepID=A0A6V7V9R4_MELEN|nr:unnamed protein product [Meloidogyne enterolobii]
MENEYNLEFVEVKSGRGRSLLSRLGFEYYFENESRTMEGVEYWRCVKRSNGYCTGRIHVLAEWRQLNEIRYKLGKIANAAHNHPADPEKQSIRDAIEKLKNLAGMENPLITREALWNLTQRIENGLSRSNNSLEAWHHVWSSLLSRRPRLSQFIKRMLKEYTRWEEIVREFQNSPADGIRGKGIRRRAIYLNQDANLQQIYAEFEQRGQNPFSICALFLIDLRAINYIF